MAATYTACMHSPKRFEQILCTLKRWVHRRGRGRYLESYRYLVDFKEYPLSALSRMR